MTDPVNAIAGGGPDMPANVTLVDHNASVFRPDPSYKDEAYNAEKQLEIYGGKYANKTARPLIELGRALYKEGPFRKGINLLGEKNLLFPHLQAYGDYRIAVAFNDNGKKEQWTLANRLNMDLDLKLTATERVHAFLRPLDKNNSFTRFDIGGDKENEFEVQLDGNADALFFEGDLGAMLTGFTNRYNKIDLPVAAGLMPMILQNGVWLEDAFTGVAATLPARNNALLDISNMDITGFFGFDKVTSRAVVKANKDLDDEQTRIYGVTAFIEAMQGYWEAGYGYTDPSDDGNAPLDDLDYHNLTAAFTRRYRGLISNSVRVIWNFGQDRDPKNLLQTADGWLFLIENSLVTSKPLSLVPYFNMFIGVDRPQSLARDAGAGGVLKNTGILFETDGLTGFPKMDDAAQDTLGGALGLEYLFNLDQQIVIETAVVKETGEGVIKGDQLGLGLRYQRPITNAWILRADTMVAFRESDDDLFGVRFEIRRKF
jgi:hypothetical protein